MTRLKPQRAFSTTRNWQENSTEPLLPNLADKVADAVTENAAKVSMQIGDLSNHGLDTILPTRLCEYLLEFTHVATGLPWWATIVAITLVFRTAFLPFVTMSQKHIARLGNTKPEIERIQERIKAAKARGDNTQMVRLSQEISGIYKKHNTSPVKAIVGNLPLLPFSVFMFFGIRDLTKLPITHMDTGGALWFTDLTFTDPYYILPVCSTVGMMLSMEFNFNSNSANGISKQNKLMLRIVGVVGVFFTSQLPAAVFVFWVTNNIFSLIQTLLFRSKWYCQLTGVDRVKKIPYARTKQETTMIDDLFRPKKKKELEKRYVVPHKKRSK
ncbi:hypothetical protein GGI26_002475 [Coemansia sp. RSA 1358]|nr:60Kd inner membrane protein-domain-containing protein [Coemansia spiralis]KAJ1986672.1 hypothetical protein EDC05_006206 [Coemansia umbellata]KAJ2623248.1 hypothetical protein GGI26_002475 [Coemansia sp. RSA 1358]